MKIISRRIKLGSMAIIFIDKDKVSKIVVGNVEYTKPFDKSILGQQMKELVDQVEFEYKGKLANAGK